MRKILFFLFVLLSISNISHAASWYFFEPGLGYYQGHYQSNKVSGMGFDIKLGINWDKLYIGADIGYASSLNVSNTSYDLDMNNTGLIIGYNSGPMRIWYSIITAATNSYKNGSVEYEATGSGTKLGIGGKLSGNTYINLEANFLKYDELSTDGTTSDVDYFMDIVLLSVSGVF